MSEVQPRDVPRTNHLAGQTSPYLLQHLHNPVDWYAWGPEALEKARLSDRPIFLSIGYSACHWCHVMERESFEDERVARILNEHFVAIKVDREERPDLDAIYMNAIQLLTGTGGWPLNVFLTPALEPFFGGTYFPPEDRDGRAGLLSILAKVHEVWKSRRAEIEDSAGRMAQTLHAIGAGGAASSGDARVGRREIAAAAADLTARFDPAWGGFGGAPKFPPHGALALLLREHARSRESVPLRMVETTLGAMALGGTYDQVGGGFARYSTDERWLVPHFEKMLYDQALLVPVYVDAWLVAREALYRRVVEETLDFVRREMTSPEGGFLSSLDADSEGHEGRYYVFRPDEVRDVLGPDDGAFFCGIYGITPEGNFDGRSILNLASGSLAARAEALGTTEERLVARLAPMRSFLLVARSLRSRPATDDKVLTAWNGLMISAFARAHEALGRPEDLRSARRAADFVLARLARDGRLLASWRDEKARLNGYLDDYAFLARGLLDLYEAGFARKYLDASARIARSLVARFADRTCGGFFFTSEDHETLIARYRSLHDGALPSGAGVAAETLLRLAAHLDDRDLEDAALGTMSAYRPSVVRSPSAFASLLAAADFADGPVREIAIVGDPARDETLALLAAIRGRYLPNRVVALCRPGESAAGLPLLEGRTEVGGAPTAYVCQDRACGPPCTEPEALARQLGD
ncbi:MAG: thioredoxin domain-containing protein [Acidobacteriia bacterium]|nr:thioredoxin domain-containing protein [Terriglobia bacterium]